MTNLSSRLLASIENHGRCSVTGIYDIYCHEDKVEVLKSLYELRAAKWIKISFSRITDPGGVRKSFALKEM